MHTVTSKWRLLALFAFAMAAVVAVTLTWGRASFQSAGAAGSEGPASVELQNSRQDWYVQSKGDFAADRVVVHIGSLIQGDKVDRVLFTCESSVPEVLPEEVWVEDPDEIFGSWGDGGHYEVWSATFSSKCINPDLGQGVWFWFFPVVPDNKLVVKQVYVQNTSDLVPQEGPIDAVKVGDPPPGDQSWKVTSQEPGKAFDRIEVDVGTAPQVPKLEDTSFRCQSSEEVVPGVLKRHEKDVQAPPLTDYEVWGATFSTKCIDDVSGVTIRVAPFDEWNQVQIKGGRVQNTSNLVPREAPANFVATGYNPTYLVTSEAKFGTNRVEVDVSRFVPGPHLQFAVFVCATTNEWVMVDAPKIEDPGDPTPTPTPTLPDHVVWSATFSTECIPPGGTVYVALFPFPFSPLQPVIEQARVENTEVKHGNLTNVVDIAVLMDDSVVFHCIARMEHDAVSNDIAAAAQCYSDTQGGGLYGHLIDGADGAPGPPPPPPYSTTPPTNLAGAYNPVTDVGTLGGCFTNMGGIFAPNTYVEMNMFDAKAPLLGTTSGTISLYLGGQAKAPCEAGNPTGEPLLVLPITARKASFLPVIYPRADPFDYDGDGCSDWDELAKTGARPKPCGDDPYNPDDSDTDTAISGISWARATVFPADWDTVNDKLIPGSYFFCINRVVDEGGNALSADVWCSWNSPANALLSGTGLPSCGDGTNVPLKCFAGHAYAHLTGVVDKLTNRVLLEGCFADVGGPPVGPNVILGLDVDAHSGQGTVDVSLGQSNAACEAAAGGGAGDSPSAAGLPVPDITADVGLGAQPDDWDSDGNGTTDEEDFAAGRNPMNPNAGDKNLGGISHVEIELVRADAGVPGIYWDCRADTDHDKGTNDLATRIYCYFDDPAITVNSEEAGQEQCPPAPADACGNGFAGDPPPRTGVAASFGDVDQAHTVLSGVHDEVGGLFTLAGCFEDIENSQLGPNIYVELAVSDNSRVGLADIWLRQGLTDCQTGFPVGPPDYGNRPIALTAVGDPDKDQDGCSDAKELGDDESLGGLRDPFNRWDLYDTNGDQNIDLFIDIFGVAFRFGASGDPTGDPTDPVPPPPAYHTAFDRGGSLTGSNTWNQKPADGNIDLFNDIFGVAFQFGHDCS